MTHTLHTGDCREVMAGLDAESVHSIVTDPPYGLSFMGKGWDHGVPGVEFWTEAMRVAKPGAHLLAFGGTRTYHRLACAIEDAGWEVRDCVMWVYGSGFPKSLDVGKAIDKRRDDREQVRRCCRWLRSKMDETGTTSRQIAGAFGFDPRMADHWAARDTDSQPSVPTLDQVPTLLGVLGLTLDDVPADIRELLWTLNGRKGQPGENWAKREVVGTRPGLNGSGFGNVGHGLTSEPDRIKDTAPATDAARQWHGWGTALKPAWEPIIVARKPLIGTVAANVQEHGCGAINVAGCRVGTTVETWPASRSFAPGISSGYTNGKAKGPTQPTGDAPQGRWPANFIHDGSDEVVGLMPDSGSGSGKPTVAKRERNKGWCNASPGEGVDAIDNYGDSGSAARFFYCAKASKKDRDEGCEGLDERVNRGSDTHANGTATTRLGNAQERAAGITHVELGKVRNHHPTVKPTDLMRYLCRLVTPPGGIVLDPFMGSGSTGKAAALEGFEFVGIEREPEYVAIATRRIEAAGQKAGIFAEAV